MTTTETKDYGFKELEEAGTFKGLLSVYDVVDEYGDVVERGAYTKTLQETDGSVPLLWHHKADVTIGQLWLTDGAEGLEAHGKILLSDDVPAGKMAYALMRSGLVRGLSIGFKTVRSKMEGKIRRLKEIRLFEGSLVAIPANRFALVSSFKQLNLDQKDFNSELELLQLYDRNYQIMSALRTALYKLAHDQKLGNEQKINAAAEAIEQFRQAYMEFLPRYLDMEGSVGYLSAADLVERSKTAPDPVRDLLREFSKKILETEGQHPGTSTDAAGAAAAESKTTVPADAEALRSWAMSLSERFGS